jgi:hypothetical protein
MLILLPLVWATKKITWTLISACNEEGLKTKVVKTKYILVSRHENAGKSQDIKK